MYPQKRTKITKKYFTSAFNRHYKHGQKNVWSIYKGREAKWSFMIVLLHTTINPINRENSIRGSKASSPYIWRREIYPETQSQTQTCLLLMMGAKKSLMHAFKWFITPWEDSIITALPSLLFSSFSSSLESFYIQKGVRELLAVHDSTSNSGKFLSKQYHIGNPIMKISLKPLKTTKDPARMQITLNPKRNQEKISHLK